MAETFSNQAVTTLSAAITTTTATSCTVTDASTFPATGNFRIKIDNEIILVTAVATNTFTDHARRGVDDSADSRQRCYRHSSVDERRFGSESRQSVHCGFVRQQTSSRREGSPFLAN